MLLDHATWIDPGGREWTGRIRLADGRIELRPDDEPAGPEDRLPSDEKVLDAAGLLVLPGLVDAHVHFRQPGERYKEGVKNGSRAALAGGVTTVLDMPNNRPPCTTARRLQRKRATFERHCLTNWGLHLHASSRLAMAPPDGIVSTKLYLARSSTLPALCSIEQITAILRTRRVVSIHAEDETVLLSGDRPLPHHVRRPRAAITSALAKIERALRSLDPTERPRLVICHISTVEELEWIARMKHERFDVWAETCPHYWTFTQDDYLAEGGRLKVNPPLRSSTDRERILQALAEGPIDLVSTDHAPHPIHLREDEPTSPSGIAGIEWFMPLLLDLVDRGILSFQRMLELGCSNAARCYSLGEGRGCLNDGAPADLVLVRKEAVRGGRPVEGRPITRAGFNPYRSAPRAWSVVATIVGGRLKYREGKFVDDTPGNEIAPIMAPR
ncbi:MAG: dihydroorotase family protein [Bradymonadales bacterium]|nr:dihydroorotase family protein [Bradymonadales bacterium]